MASSRGKLILVFGILVAVSALGAGFFAFKRHHREHKESETRQQDVDRGETLYVISVEVTAGEREVTLPGEVLPFQQAQLYARVNGYLRRLTVFPGDTVRHNQLLGSIESPETDQQVAGGLADESVRNRNAERARQLTPSGVLPQQSLDQAEADLKGSEATLRRLRAMQEYEQLRAPFDGVVTARYVDPGALVAAQVPVVEITDSTVVKVTVFVGQDVAPFVKAGDNVDIRQQERPDLVVHGKVTRTANALDPRSRTMRTEIWLDNKETKLQAGTFVRVTLKVQAPPLPTVPNETTFVRGDSLMVGLVKDDRIHFQHIDPGINDGRKTQVRSGLKAGDKVALNVPSDLDDGVRIRAEDAKKAGNKPGAPGASGPSPDGGAAVEGGGVMDGGSGGSDGGAAGGTGGGASPDGGS